ncbi:hypothetical protein M426DRAFT_322425 [Hypoxylon sp. CI-4A]|nr:hypothetical protein M426DRAFT_322425 [Hypoxylon sp. CI-4A]
MSGVFKQWPHLSQNTGSTSNLDQAKDWLQQCDASHDNCTSVQSVDYLPTRVLDVSRQEDRIFVVEKDLCPTKPYVTLSHCWGHRKPIQTTVASLPTFRTDGIALTSLPKTFREAVLATRHLGCSYLWIDSLCIIQGRDGDWVSEAPRMADVYRNAYVTIAASASSDGTGGLFHMNDINLVQYAAERRLEDGSLTTVYVRPAIDHAAYVHGHLHPLNPLYPAPLLQRGWFFQEQTLSRRIIFFTNFELVWQCEEVSTCICEVRENRGVMSTNQVRSNLSEYVPKGRATDLHRSWVEIVHLYTEGQLSFDSDRLAALAAIAKLMSGTALGRYMSGLWETTLASGLIWTVVGSSLKDDSIIPRRTEDKSMPSWSWASVISPVSSTLYSPQSPDFEIVDIHFESDNADSFVKANAKALTVRGMVCECMAWYSGRGYMRSIQQIGMEREYAFVADVGSEVSCGRDEAIVVYVLRIQPLHGIVIRKVEDQKDTYRRLGVIGSQNLGEAAMKAMTFTPMDYLKLI